jgi:hypothetical protein
MLCSVNRGGPSSRKSSTMTHSVPYCYHLHSRHQHDSVTFLLLPVGCCTLTRPISCMSSLVTLSQPDASFVTKQEQGSSSFLPLCPLSVYLQSAFLSVLFFLLLFFFTQSGRWLRHCATSRKVVGWRLDDVIGIFH